MYVYFFIVSLGMTLSSRQENGVLAPNFLSKEAFACKESQSISQDYENVKMLFVACGKNSIEEAMTAIKTAILLRHDHVTYSIYFYTEETDVKFASKKVARQPRVSKA